MNESISDKTLQRLISINPSLKSLLVRLATLGSVAVTGGFVRDIVFNKVSSDIDLVVDCDYEKLNTCLFQFYNCRTLFTNLLRKTSSEYKIFKLSIDNLNINIWSLNETGTLKNREKTFENLVANTSFDIQGIAITLGGKVFENGFYKAIESKVFDTRGCEIKKYEISKINDFKQRFPQFKLGPNLTKHEDSLKRVPEATVVKGVTHNIVDYYASTAAVNNTIHLTWTTNTIKYY